MVEAANNAVIKKMVKQVAPATLKLERPAGEVVYQTNVAPCSVEVGMTAKGETTWTIKAYCESVELDDTIKRVTALNDALTTRYRKKEPDGK